MEILKTIFKVLLFAILISACNSSTVNNAAAAKEEVAKAEKDFAEMAAQKGIAEAFWFFADSNAVVKRGNDSLIKGKEGIRNFYPRDFYKSASVKWSPDFIDASANGDLAYTYGKYVWRSKDSSGTVNEIAGVFHTVWKKQKDGSWKYVWD